MNIDLCSDFPLTDDACKEGTGKTLADWYRELDARPELAGKRREGVMFICDQIGRTTAGVWWGTTIWVENERRIGKLQKDGRIEGYFICSTKTIKASPTKVQEAILPFFTDVVRVREGKDIRANWRTPGSPNDSSVEVIFAASGDKTGITLNHNRIQTREEADGLRRYWSEKLSQLKTELES